MSKLADSLKRVYRNTSQSIGFRRSSVHEETNSILILADITSSTLKRVKEIVGIGVDGLLIHYDSKNAGNLNKISKAAANVPVGIGLTVSNNKAQISQKTGYDFVMADLKTGPDILNDESLGRLLVVTETIMPAMIKAINDLDINIDGVVIDYKDSSVDIQFLLTCHLFSDLLNKPLLIRVYESDITETEIKALCTAGVRGLILPEDILVGKIKAIKKAIAALPANARKTKHGTAIIPGISFGQREVEEVEEVEEEE